MSKYRIHISSKTKILNSFRLLFKIPIFNSLLIGLTQRSQHLFVQKLVPPNYLFKKGNYRIVSRNGIRYKLDISNVVDHSFYYNLELPSYHSIIDHIKNAKVILDIGGNIGTSALYYANQNSGARILSFEPHPVTFIQAKENISLNKFSNIEMINVGLGPKNETLKLYEVDENNPGMNRILNEDIALPYKLIEVVILDEILKSKNISKVDFIKIDVEGFEHAVLLGAAETLKHKPILFIEVNNNHLKENNSSAKALVHYLMKFNYSNFYRADNLEKISAESNFENCHFDLIAL